VRARACAALLARVGGLGTTRAADAERLPGGGGGKIDNRSRGSLGALTRLGLEENGLLDGVGGGGGGGTAGVVRYADLSAVRPGAAGPCASE
jgi:hypothetical protein